MALGLGCCGGDDFSQETHDGDAIDYSVRATRWPATLMRQNPNRHFTPVSLFFNIETLILVYDCRCMR